MQKLSIKKMSVLGLVLMGAAALTAAVVPAKEKKDKKTNDNNGRLYQNSFTGGAPVLTCISEEFNPINCTATAASITTGALADSFVGTALTDQTEGNTSNTLAIPDVNGVDQTSDVR